MSEAPRVYSAIAAVTRALGKEGIAKSRTNTDNGYAFRSIDDIYAALNPLLVRHKLCMLPRMLERGSGNYRMPNGELLFSTWVRAAFDFVSVADGSRHVVETFGEAMDRSDKGTTKAMSAAFKYAAMQSFCIPVAGAQDVDASTPSSVMVADQPPNEGWARWAGDIIAVIGSCQTDEALDRIQAIHRERLRSLSKAEPSLYTEIGDAIGERRAGMIRRHKETA